MYFDDGGQILNSGERVGLCEVLDRVLNKGVVVSGQVTISVADVDLVYLGLQLVVTSMETACESFRLGGSGGTGLKLDLGRKKENSGFSGKRLAGV